MQSNESLDYVHLLMCVRMTNWRTSREQSTLIIMCNASCRTIRIEIISALSFFIIPTVFLDGSKQQNIPSWEQLIGHSILIEYKLSFAVNFSDGECNFSEFVEYLALLHRMRQHGQCPSSKCNYKRIKRKRTQRKYLSKSNLNCIMINALCLCLPSVPSNPNASILYYACMPRRTV